MLVWSLLVEASVVVVLVVAFGSCVGGVVDCWFVVLDEASVVELVG
jgi:hypothetical protein